jgi:hypothetical protein
LIEWDKDLELEDDKRGSHVYKDRYDFKVKVPSKMFISDLQY